MRSGTLVLVTKRFSDLYAAPTGKHTVTLTGVPRFSQDDAPRTYRHQLEGLTCSSSMAEHRRWRRFFLQREKAS
jgi:hypothetical protein